MNQKQRKDLNKYVNNHNEKIRATEESEFNEVKADLEDTVKVLSFRRNAFKASEFVFETDALCELEVEEIRNKYLINAITPEHNLDNQRNHLDDIRLRVRVQLREEYKDKDTSDEGENFTFVSRQESNSNWRERAKIQAASFGGTGAI